MLILSGKDAWQKLVYQCRMAFSLHLRYNFIVYSYNSQSVLIFFKGAPFLMDDINEINADKKKIERLSLYKYTYFLIF